MPADRSPPPGVDTFWEQADADSSDEHPLARELEHRLDALVRYQAMIGDALASGEEQRVEHLLRQQEREAELVRRLRHALRVRDER